MTPEQGKFLCNVYLDANQYEAETTKKVIRAVPDDKKAYTPDPKSMTAHQLAWHITSSEVFILDVILLDGKMPEGRPPDAPPTISAILDWYETNLPTALPIDVRGFDHSTARGPGLDSHRNRTRR